MLGKVAWSVTAYPAPTAGVGWGGETAWWHMPVILELGRWRQDDPQGLKDSQFGTLINSMLSERPCLKIKAENT